MKNLTFAAAFLLTALTSFGQSKKWTNISGNYNYLDSARFARLKYYGPPGDSIIGTDQYGNFKLVKAAGGSGGSLTWQNTLTNGAVLTADNAVTSPTGNTLSIHSAGSGSILSGITVGKDRVSYVSTDASGHNSLVTLEGPSVEVISRSAVGTTGGQISAGLTGVSLGGYAPGIINRITAGNTSDGIKIEYEGGSYYLPRGVPTPGQTFIATNTGVFGFSTFSNANFANTDLIATGNRRHSWGFHDFRIDSIFGLDLYSYHPAYGTTYIHQTPEDGFSVHSADNTGRTGNLDIGPTSFNLSAIHPTNGIALLGVTAPTVSAGLGLISANNANITADGVVTAAGFVGALTGNASTATSAAALTTGRTISGTGDAVFTTTAFDGSGNVSGAVTVSKVNGVAFSGLATGLLKNTTGTGAPSIAVAGTDYVTPAGSVATLSTPRYINGSAFDGSANISTDIKTRAYQALGSTILAQNVDGDLATGVSGASMNSQRVYYFAVYLPIAATITGVKWIQITAGDYTANNYNGVGLFTYSGGTLTKVASSTDDGNIWKATSGTMSSKTFSSTYSATAGLYFVALMYSSSAQVTAPSLGIIGTASTINTVTDFTNSAKTSSLITGQTALPGSTQAMSGLTAAATEYKVYLY